jgi:hypothetical protein
MDAWERGWLEHWSKAELPKTGAVGAEAAFLTEVATLRPPLTPISSQCAFAESTSPAF